VVSYLALGLDRTLMFTSILTRWKPDAECLVDVFARQALPMLWDYAENNPVYPHSGAFVDQIGRILYSLKQTFISYTPAAVIQSSATSLSNHDNHFDAVITDPPYYDNVPYSGTV
jgi:putative DNA methylase